MRRGVAPRFAQGDSWRDESGRSPPQQIVHRSRTGLAPLPALRISRDRRLDGLCIPVLVGDQAQPVGQGLAPADPELHHAGVLVQPGNLALEVRHARDVAVVADIQLGLLGRIEAVLEPRGLLDRPSRRRGPGEARQATSILVSIVHRHVVALEHPPPHRLLLPPVELHQPADQLVESRLLRLALGSGIRPLEQARRTFLGLRALHRDRRWWSRLLGGIRARRRCRSPAAVPAASSEDPKWTRSPPGCSPGCPSGPVTPPTSATRRGPSTAGTRSPSRSPRRRRPRATAGTAAPLT